MHPISHLYWMLSSIFGLNANNLYCVDFCSSVLLSIHSENQSSAWNCFNDCEIIFSISGVTQKTAIITRRRSRASIDDRWNIGRRFKEHFKGLSPATPHQSDNIKFFSACLIIVVIHCKTVIFSGKVEEERINLHWHSNDMLNSQPVGSQQQVAVWWFISV